MISKQDRKRAIASLHDDIIAIRVAARVAERRSTRLAEKMRQAADEWADQYTEMCILFADDYGESYDAFPEQK